MLSARMRALSRRSGYFPPPPTTSYPGQRSPASGPSRARNLLVRVVLRDLDKTLTNEAANALRDRIYRALHQGRQYQWAK